MSDRGLAIREYRAGSEIRWGVIWAGVFVFAAIWSVFEMLGVALLPTNGANGMSVALEVWTVILTIIAMYVAGLETGRMAGIANRHDGLVNGMTMFGLAAVSAVILLAFENTGLATAAAATTPHSVYLTTGSQWGLFCAFFFGWLAAMGGASTGVARRLIGNVTGTTTRVQEPVPMRPAA